MSKEYHKSCNAKIASERGLIINYWYSMDTLCVDFNSREIHLTFRYRTVCKASGSCPINVIGRLQRQVHGERSYNRNDGVDMSPPQTVQVFPKKVLWRAVLRDTANSVTRRNAWRDVLRDAIGTQQRRRRDYGLNKLTKCVPSTSGTKFSYNHLFLASITYTVSVFLLWFRSTAPQLTGRCGKHIE